MARAQREKTGDMDIVTKGQAPEVFIAEQAAAMARQRGEKELVVASTNINAEYRKRIVETQELASRIQHNLDVVQAELKHAVKARESVVKALTEVQRPLSLTMDWYTARSRHVNTPSGETVDRALNQTTHDLKGVIDTLSTLLIELDKALAGLRTTEQRYQSELHAKQSNIVLDRACVSGALDRSAGQLESPRLQRALLATHGMHTENEWRNRTSASLSVGVSAIEDSKKLRKKIQAAVKGIEESGKTKRPAAVVDALRSHSKYEAQQCQSLKYNAKMVSGEMVTLEKHHATISSTLARVRQQLAEANRRLTLQVVRPQGETARTGVEEVLEIELVNMRRTEKSLMKQLTELEVKLDRLTHHRDKIDREHEEHVKAQQLDQRCEAMELPALPQIADRYLRESLPTHGIASGRRAEVDPAASPRGGLAMKASPRGAYDVKASPRGRR